MSKGRLHQMSADLKQVKGARRGETASDSLLQLRPNSQFVEDVVHVVACSCNGVQFASRSLLRHHLVVFQFVAPDAQPRV